MYRLVLRFTASDYPLWFLQIFLVFVHSTNKLLIETFEKTHLAQIPCLNQFTRQTLVRLCTILRACFTSPSLYQLGNMHS
jgi:hypothetical protein